MDEWLHNLPVWWMAFVIIAIAYLAAGGIFVIIMALAKGERVHVFKSVSLSLLPPLGTIFGLLVAFSAVQVWNDMDRAKVAVDREASAIRMVVLLATSFPGEPEAQIRTLVRRHIDEAVVAEWPTMAKQSASLTPAASNRAAAMICKSIRNPATLVTLTFSARRLSYLTTINQQAGSETNE